MVLSMTENHIARTFTWALALGTAIGIVVFFLFYRQTDGWADNTTRPPAGYYQEVTVDDLETWPWTYKSKLVVVTGDVRRVIDGPAYIDPLVRVSGRRLLGGLRVQRQVVLASQGQREAIVAIDFQTPAELPGRLTVSGRFRGPRALTSPLGDEPERPVIEAYEVCGDNGACWSP